MERKRLLIQNLNSNLSDRGVRRVKIAGLLLMVAVKDLTAELLVRVETLHKALTRQKQLDSPLQLMDRQQKGM